jgi:YVTN family beta-propeller protein
MKSLKVLFIITAAFLYISCETKVPLTDMEFVAESIKGEGVFIINEGNYLAGNGTLSFYSYRTGKILNNIFAMANGRPLGDVPNSMVISGNNGYIVVNNSGRIEVVEKNTMRSVRTINDLGSPRNILPVSGTKAYVSSLYSNSLAIIDLNTNSLSGKIDIRRSSEAMVFTGNKVYVSSWYSGTDVMVLNALTDKVIDSIRVAPEPESMVLDKNNKLWILCSGGFTGNSLAELLVVNTVTDEIEKKIVFPSKLSYPSNLQINNTGDTVYYLDNGIRRLSIESSVLPDETFLNAGKRFIYKLGFDKRNGRIFYTDAIDYQQKGWIFQINSKGFTIDSCRGDIIPGSFCFK